MRDKQAGGEDGNVKAPKKKPNILVRFLAFLVTLALILGAVTLVVYRDRINLDSIKRYFTYRSLERNDNGQADSFRHGGSAGDGFAAAEGNLLVCSPGAVRLFSSSGTKYVEEQVNLSNPVVSAAGAWSLAYDAGGRDLLVFKGKEKAYSLNLDLEIIHVLKTGESIPSPTLGTGKSILSARINAAGYLAVTTQSSGHKGSVAVFGPDGNFLIQINLSSSFVMDALVSADGKWLCAVTIGEGNAAFESKLAFYQLERTKDQTEADAVCPLGGNLVMDLCEGSEGYWALGDSTLFLADHSGALVGYYSYGGRYLKEFSLGGDGFAAILLGKYRAGTLADLVVVDDTGSQTASLSFNEQVLSLSAAGRYVAVLTADRLTIYTSDLTPYASLDGVQGARKVLMRSDGTAMLISGDTARLFIPS